MSASKLVGHIVTTLIEAGIDVSLLGKKKGLSEDGSTSAGGFNDEDKLVEVAAKRDDWVTILAHEYCHFLQFKEGLFDDLTQIAAYAGWNPWISGKREYTPELVVRFTRAMQWLELDCERRTIELLDEWKVKYDKEKYIRKSNVYVYTYELMRKVRRENKKSIYETDPKILELVPGDRLITEDDFGRLPDGFEAVALKAYDFSAESEEEED